VFDNRMRLIRFLALPAAMAFPGPITAQSLLDRPPNMSGDWSGAPGTLYFHFVHRFAASSAPERKVSNVPTFLLAAGLPARFLAGFNYSTNSTLTPRFPNEWELFARWLPLSQDYGSPVDLGAHVGYNNASEGIDGEVTLGRRVGITRVLVAGRALSDPFEEGNARFALAGGATVRLGQFVALAGDVSSLLDRDSTERVAWSAGIHFAIPLTPHTVSLHATNAALTTLQGASRGSRDVRYGFEFTIPLTLRRYFGSRSRADSLAPVAAAPSSPIVNEGTPSPPVVKEVSPGADTVSQRPAPGATPMVTAPPPAPPPRAAASTPRTTPVPARSTPPRATATAPKPAPATSASPKQAARVVKTGIKNVNYLQPRLQVTAGTTVEWTNNDPMPHTVTATDKSFDSGLINPGKTYRHTFTKAGTYNFFCTPHPFMKGTIVVKAP
jgi:amicyanin